MVLAEAVDEEPVLRAIKENWAKIRKTWDEANLPPVAKIALLIAGAVVFVVNFAAIAPVAISLLIIYGVYWIVRKIVLAWQEPQVGQRKYTVASPPGEDRAQGWSPVRDQAARHELESAAAEIRKQRKKELKAQRKVLKRPCPPWCLALPGNE